MAKQAPEDVGRIELKLRELGQLFDSLDPAPFRERSIDHDAEAFIVSWARDLRHHDALELRIHLPSGKVGPEAEPLVAEAVHHHFEYLAEAKRLEFRALMSRGRSSLAVGLAFLTVCLLVGNAIGKSSELGQIGSIVRESLLIGGWVAMWRPIEIFLYDWWGVRREQRDFERVSRAPVHIVKAE